MSNEDRISKLFLVLKKKTQIYLYYPCLFVFFLFSFINPLIIKASFKYGISNTKSSILKARDITSPDTFTGLSKFQPSPQPYVHTYAETKSLGMCVVKITFLL